MGFNERTMMNFMVGWGIKDVLQGAKKSYERGVNPSLVQKI